MIPKIHSGLEVCLYAGIGSYAGNLLAHSPPTSTTELLASGLLYGLALQIFPHKEGQRPVTIPAAMSGYTIGAIMLQLYS